jgi:hypothetical protein
VPDPGLAAIYPRQFPAELWVRTADGREWTVRVERNRGGPGRPLSDAEHGVKFAMTAGRALPGGTVRAVRRAVLALADGGGVTALTELLRVEASGQGPGPDGSERRPGREPESPTRPPAKSSAREAVRLSIGESEQ